MSFGICPTCSHPIEQESDPVRGWAEAGNDAWLCLWCRSVICVWCYAGHTRVHLPVPKKTLPHGVH